MTTFPDLRTLDHFNQETSGAATLTLPIGGRDYTWTVAMLSIRAGMYLQQARVQIEALTAQITEARAAAVKAGLPPGSAVIDPDTEILADVSAEEFDTELIGADKIAQMAGDGVKWAELQFVGVVLLAWHLNGTAAARDMWLGGQDKPDPKAPKARTTKTGGSATPRKSPARNSTGRKSSPRGTSSKPTSTGSTGTT